MLKTAGNPVHPVHWKVTSSPVDYPEAVSYMEQRVIDIQEKKSSEEVWLLEHPSLYTVGTSGKNQDILGSQKIPVFKTGRGGQVTYHGPGQRIAYVMLDLKSRTPDLRLYVWHLEEWLIKTLDHFNIQAERRAERIGLWVVDPLGQEKKIAAIGVRVQKWVTFHGVALNVSPDLSYYKDIIPCGIRDFGVTSMKDCGIDVSYDDLDPILQKTFQEIF